MVHQVIQGDRAVEEVAVVELLQQQVEQQLNQLNQETQEHLDLEIRVDQEVLVQLKLQEVEVELVLQVSQVEFQNQEQQRVEQEKM